MSAPVPVPAPRRSAGMACFAASLSGAAVLSHAAGWLRMPFFITCISLPATLLVVALSLRSRGRADRWLAQRVWAGCWIGLLATLAYDVTRLFIQVSGIYAFYPFRIIVPLGVLITGRAEFDPLAIVAGWTFHFWNGVNFAMMYVLALGRGRLALAIAWALLLEVMMLLSYPPLFDISRWNIGFVATSMIGHVAYGIVLGLCAERLELLPLRSGERP